MKRYFKFAVKIETDNRTGIKEGFLIDGSKFRVLVKGKYVDPYNLKYDNVTNTTVIKINYTTYVKARLISNLEPKTYTLE